MGLPVLIVDDQADIRDALAATLETLGAQPLVAVDGGSALDLLHHGARPRLILLDMMMPGIDGFKFRAIQLEDPDLASIPVVAITARYDAEVVGRRLGIPVLTKPVQYDDVVKVVEQVARTNEPSSRTRAPERPRHGAHRPRPSDTARS